MTYESILARMKSACGGLDTREGSFLHVALAPVAIELQNLYLALDETRNESFADTASRESLARRCLERGITPGADETAESLRARYLASFDAVGFAGNAAAYRALALAEPGVTACRVLPATPAPGCVTLVLRGGDVSAVQAAIEKVAPIGHTVICTAAAEVPITVSATVTGVENPDVAGAAGAYFASLAEAWEAGPIKVRVAGVTMAILAIPGVTDVANVTLNGAAQDVLLAADEVPVYA